jgi:hypothetical protein
MLTFVFLFFIAVFAVAGVVISLAAKKHKGVAMPRRVEGRHSTALGRANSDED